MENLTLQENSLREHLNAALLAVQRSKNTSTTAGHNAAKSSDAQNYLLPVCEESLKSTTDKSEMKTELPKKEATLSGQHSQQHNLFPLRLFISSVGVRSKSEHGWELAIMGELFDVHRSFDFASFPHLSICMVSLVTPSDPW